MATPAPATEDPGPVQTGSDGEMGFNVEVFKKYLSALLPPGKLPFSYTDQDADN